MGYLRQGSFQRKKMALGYLYALCVWIGLLHPSLGTGFVYRFPGIALQRQRIHSERGSSAGPPGAGSSLRCAHSGGLAAICNLFCLSAFISKNCNSLTLRFRNWCQYTASRSVPCKVHNGTETSVQRVMQGCRWPGPCSKVIR